MPPKRSSKGTSKSALPKAQKVKTTDGNSAFSQTALGDEKALGNDEDAGSGDTPTIEIPFAGKTITAQPFSPHKEAKGDALPVLIFTHGAGGGIANPAISCFAKGFASQADVILFQGTMNLQSRVKAFHTVIEHFHSEDAALGGRSMGARAAVHAAKDHETNALVLASYPLVGQNGEMRDQILFEISENVDVLFISGDQDHMCKIDQLKEVRTKMRAKSWLVIVEGADHSMSLKSKAGIDILRQYVGTLAAEWLAARDTSKTERSLSWDSADKKVKDSGWKNSMGRKTASIKDAFAKQSMKPDKEEVSMDEHPKKRRKKD
ncbi:hypothetical protein DV736_g5058, partial [Chaetothyriales sp. CBS 134916]